MNVSLFLAKFFGIYLIIIAVSVIINRKRISDIALQMVDNMAIIFTAGIFTLILGIALVLIHNVWVFGWPVVVTLLCWLTFVRGAVTVLFPQFGKKMVKATQNTMYYGIVGLFSLVLGIWLVYVGFAG